MIFLKQETRSFEQSDKYYDRSKPQQGTYSEHPTERQSFLITHAMRFGHRFEPPSVR